MLANDVSRLHRLCWIAETSMLKTLAAKHQSTVAKMAAKYKAKIETPYGLRRCFEARVERQGKQPLVARFGGIPLVRNKDAILADRTPPRVPYPRKELVTRLLKRRCELCEEPAKVTVHQVRSLASLGKPDAGQPPWAALMTRMRRKTLVVCQACHDAIHHGQSDRPSGIGHRRATCIERCPRGSVEGCAEKDLLLRHLAAQPIRLLQALWRQPALPRRGGPPL
jgi:hypothetical protein